MHAYIKMGHKNKNIYNYTVRKRKNEDINLKINKFQFVVFTYIYKLCWHENKSGSLYIYRIINWHETLGRFAFVVVLIKKKYSIRNKIKKKEDANR